MTNPVEILICAALALLGFRFLGVLRFMLAVVLFLIFKLFVFRKRPAKASGEPASNGKKPFSLLKPTVLALAIVSVYHVCWSLMPIPTISVTYTPAEDAVIHTVDALGGITLEIPKSLGLEPVEPAAGTDVVFASANPLNELEVELDVFDTDLEYNDCSEEELLHHASERRGYTSSLAHVYSSHIVNTEAKRYVRMHSRALLMLDCVIYVTNHGDQGLMLSAFTPGIFSEEQLSQLDQIAASIRLSNP